MKAGWSILFCMLVLFGCGEAQDPEEAAVEAAAPPESDLKRELDFVYGSEPAPNPLAPEPIPQLDPDESVYEHLSFADQLLDMINPNSLRKYEGSFTVAEFRTRQEDEVPEYSLSSAWVIHNQQLPRAGIKVARNPVTGKYEVSGGEVVLQESGLGVSYEKDEGSGETKTFLNLQRRF